MTDAEFLLHVLKDNQPHSQVEILRRSYRERGHGLTVHSRAASLRDKGYVIHCERVPGGSRGDAWTYRLIGNLDEIPSSPGGDDDVRGEDPRSPGEAGQQLHLGSAA